MSDAHSSGSSCLELSALPLSGRGIHHGLPDRSSRNRRDERWWAFQQVHGHVEQARLEVGLGVIDVPGDVFEQVAVQHRRWRGCRFTLGLRDVQALAHTEKSSINTIAILSSFAR